MSLKDRAMEVFLHAVRKGAARTMDLPPEPKTHACFAVTVTKNEELTPYLRRITITAPEIAQLTPEADEYFGFILPPKGAELHLPDASSINVRAELNAIPEEVRPDLRWYTIRHHRPESAEIDVDILVHGRTGPGTIFALDAQPGDTVGYRTLSATWHLVDGERLIVADPTAAPAARRILEVLDGAERARTHLIVATPDDEHLEPGFLEAAEGLATFSIVRADVNTQAEMVVEELTRRGPWELNHAWVCGEAQLAKQVRRFLVREWKMEKTSILFSGYWRVGAARA